jgi:hypothetical protein
MLPSPFRLISRFFQNIAHRFAVGAAKEGIAFPLPYRFPPVQERLIREIWRDVQSRLPLREPLRTVERVLEPVEGDPGKIKVGAREAIVAKVLLMLPDNKLYLVDVGLPFGKSFSTAELARRIAGALREMTDYTEEEFSRKTLDWILHVSYYVMSYRPLR